MVVGGGISGIQAALDLATAGFKVYLVEKSPTIGGKMAQLDKTFPTNDCSMCIESPKFIECDRQPNIEIMTYTEVAGVEGKAGDFKVTLVKKPRYIVRGQVHRLHDLRRVLPGQDPGPVQPEPVAQQGHSHLLRPGGSPCHLHRRQLPLSEGQDLRDLPGGLRERRHRLQPGAGEDGSQGRGDRAVAGLRDIRPQAEGRLRLRNVRERRHQPRFRAAALRHRAV